jgi:hypothetical protein
MVVVRADSSSSAGTAAQLIATNGLAARALPPWIARASTSLPLPLAPVISTAESVRDTRRASSMTACIAGLRVTRPSAKRRPSPSSAAVPPTWRRTQSSRRSRSTGLVRKSTAPRCVARTASGMSPCAEISATGRPGQRCWMRASSSMPSMPGMRRSASTKPGRASARRSSASSPEAAVVTS